MENATSISFAIGVVWTVMLGLALALIVFYLYYRTTVLRSEKEKQLEIFKASSEAEEKQKERIANSLHDNINALLTVVIQNIDQNIKDLNSNKLKIESLKNDKQLVIQCIEDVKEAALELIPKVLINYGLISALKAFSNKIFGDSIIIKVENITSFDFESPFLKADELHIYRLCQEILNNLKKHDQFTRLTIQLLEDKNMLYIKFKHDGKGITNSEIQEHSYLSSGFGLKSMQTRLLYLTGSINYTARESEREIEVAIPYRNP